MAVPGSIAERSIGYQQILAAAVDVGTLLTVPAGTSLVTIVPEGQAVRYRDDGVDPTATVGMPLAVGSFLRYDAANLLRLKFISQVAGGILNVTYYAQ